MKITDITTYIVGNAWKNWLFVRVDTDEGLHGIGEATLNGFAKTTEAAIHELKHLMLGQDPFDVENHTLRLFREVYSDGGQIQGAALSGNAASGRPSGSLRTLSPSGFSKPAPRASGWAGHFCSRAPAAKRYASSKRC